MTTSHHHPLGSDEPLFNAVAKPRDYRGLSRFLRWSIQGTDMLPIAQAMLTAAQEDLNSATNLMNLSLLMQCLSHREMGIEFQTQALELERVYVIRATQRPHCLRILMLMVPGDLAANTPLECLFEDSDVEIIHYFLTPGEPFAHDVPDHDVCYVALSESDANRQLLDQLEVILEDWHRPVLNAPSDIPKTDRQRASRLLQGIEGLQIPQTYLVDADDLKQVSLRMRTLESCGAELHFPIIIRPEGSHAGVGLARLESPAALGSYLQQGIAQEYFVANFIDYSDHRGLYRKFRIAMVGGKPYPCHMGISENWMIHYVNAGMYDDARKRAEEARFFAGFADFEVRHAEAFAQIQQRIGLDYFCIDCSEARDGRLLVFELDHCMVVHAMDPIDMFPYKIEPMRRVQEALRKFMMDQRTVIPLRRRPHNDLNFSGGPGVLPSTVLAEVSEAILEVPDVGLSILGISHRSDWFINLVDSLEVNIKSLLGLGDDYRVLFMQGGATQQFAMVPLTLLGNENSVADYIESGYWSRKSIEEAQRIGQTRIVWSGRDIRYTSLPTSDELVLNQQAAYLHYVSNETVEGLQFDDLCIGNNVPLVCDMSSDFLSRPCEASRFSIIYAHAQKNLGPSGVTIVTLRKEVLDRVPGGLPSCLDYRQHAMANSIYNTPPTFAIFVMHRIVDWIMNEVGGLEEMARRNAAKAAMLYDVIDGSDGFYIGRANLCHRSTMNVVFNMASARLERQFIDQAAMCGFSGLEGHRSIGGLRASIYNAMSLDAVAELVGFMDDFRAKAQRGHRRAA